MKKIIYIVSISIVLCMIQACPPPPPPPELPIVGTWRITGLAVNGTPVNVTSQDNFTLSKDGSYMATLPELSFFPSSGTWALSDDSKQLTLNGGDQMMNVITLNETDMVLEYIYDNFKAEDVRYRLTMKKNAPA